MSTITSEWQYPSADRPAVHPVKDGKPSSRDEEFRAALDRYMIGYRARRRSERIGRMTE